MLTRSPLKKKQDIHLPFGQHHESLHRQAQRFPQQTSRQVRQQPSKNPPLCVFVHTGPDAGGGAVWHSSVTWEGQVLTKKTTGSSQSPSSPRRQLRNLGPGMAAEALASLATRRRVQQPVVTRTEDIGLISLAGGEAMHAPLAPAPLVVVTCAPALYFSLLLLFFLLRYIERPFSNGLLRQ